MKIRTRYVIQLKVFQYTCFSMLSLFQRADAFQENEPNDSPKDSLGKPRWEEEQKGGMKKNKKRKK